MNVAASVASSVGAHIEASGRERAAGRAHDARKLLGAFELRLQAVANRRVQHRRGRRRGDGHRDPGDERVARRAGRHHDDARAGAELPGSIEHRRDEPVGDRVAARGQRRGRDEHRVDAAHLRVDGDRDRAGRGEVGERAPAAERTGERDRGDLGREHERGAHLGARALDHREHAVGRTGRGQRIGDERGASARGPRMRRMRLHDHRTPRGEGCDGVATGHREREGKLLAAKLATGPIGTSMRRRSPRGGTESGSGSSTTASTYDPSATSAANARTWARVLRPFAGEPGGAERGLAVGHLEQVVPGRVEGVGDGVQPRDPVVVRAVPGRGEGPLGGGRRGLDLRDRGLRVLADHRARPRIVRLEGRRPRSLPRSARAARPDRAGPELIDRGDTQRHPGRSVPLLPASKQAAGREIDCGLLTTGWRTPCPVR